MMGFVITSIVEPLNLKKLGNSVTSDEHVDLAMVGLDECNTCNYV